MVRLQCDNGPDVLFFGGKARVSLGSSPEDEHDVTYRGIATDRIFHQRSTIWHQLGHTYYDTHYYGSHGEPIEHVNKRVSGRSVFDIDINAAAKTTILHEGLSCP